MTVLLERSPRPGQRASLALELAMYVAAILVAVGSAFIVSQFWDELASPGRLGIGLVVAAVGFLSARALHGVAPDTLARPAAVARTVGVGGVALSAGVIARWAGADSPETIALAVGPPVLALGVLDWRGHDRPLPFLTALAGLITTLSALAAIADLTPRIGGAVLWSGAMVVLVATVLGKVEPRELAAVVAVFGTYVGSAMFAAENERPGVLIALASIVLVLAIGLAASSTPVIAASLVLFALTLPRAMAAYLHGLGAALGMLLVGVAALAWLVPRLVRRAARTEPPPPEDLTNRPGTPR